MTITVNPQTRITMLDPDFISVVNKLLEDTSLNGPGIIALNFRDPKYSATNGGYHPVEIHVDSKGDVLCITDFSFAGAHPFIELGIELDWSFDQGYFRQFDTVHDLVCGRSLLGLYLANFTAYFQSGVYQVEITSL